MSLAMAMVIVGEGFIVASTSYGAGRHLGDIPLENISMGMKLNFITQPIFLLAICIVKLAVGSTLLRIATEKIYKRIIIGIMSFMAFYTIGCFFVRFREMGVWGFECLLTVFDRQSSASVPTFARCGTSRSPKPRFAGGPRRFKASRTPT